MGVIARCSDETETMIQLRKDLYKANMPGVTAEGGMVKREGTGGPTLNDSRGMLDKMNNNKNEGTTKYEYVEGCSLMETEGFGGKTRIPRGQRIDSADSANLSIRRREVLKCAAFNEYVRKDKAGTVIDNNSDDADGSRYRLEQDLKVIQENKGTGIPFSEEDQREVR